MIGKPGSNDPDRSKEHSHEDDPWQKLVFFRLTIVSVATAIALHFRAFRLTIHFFVFIHVFNVYVFLSDF